MGRCVEAAMRSAARQLLVHAVGQCLNLIAMRSVACQLLGHAVGQSLNLIGVPLGLCSLDAGSSNWLHASAASLVNCIQADHLHWPAYC